MSTFEIKDTEVAAIVRYVVDREVARHQRMKSEGAQHAAVVTLRSFGMSLNDAKSSVAIAMDERTDPIVGVLNRSGDQQFSGAQVQGLTEDVAALHAAAIARAREIFGNRVRIFSTPVRAR